MSILVDEKSKVIVQGITGRDGSFHTKAMLDYGTKVVAGATPGKGGTECVGVPVFDSVQEARDATGADTSVVYVPAAFAADAVHEAFDAGIQVVVCVTEGIPTFEVMRIYGKMKALGVRMIGPNCPGIISPGKCKVGIMPGHIHSPGKVGVVSRSGTLTYEVVDQLTSAGLGQSTCIGIGGDPIIGTNFIDALELFEKDPETEVVVLIGEIGGTDEEEAAEFVKSEVKKPVVAFVAGQTAPPGKRMGHAGAIVSGGTGTAKEKIEAFSRAGISVAEIPSQISGLVANLVKTG
ncbi:MAG: succinate--CoA ligase subunit alpha [Candidatus Eiseniibacteriota bacterium]|nr:MAG: succinate--CoA ligase subunit alpha [Candidatus Eisenbacteria bacterium]